MTLRQSLKSALWHGVGLSLLFVGAIAVAASLLPTQHVLQSPEPAPGVSEIRQRSGHMKGVQELIAAHDCWVSSAPVDMRGKQPGHAVVTWPGDDRPTYGAARAVRVALEHTFTQPVRGFAVHAFCR